jgi:BMFP domain-containing protein YqiC
MFVKPKGNQPTREEYDALLERLEALEQKLAQLAQRDSKRGRPKTEDKNG